ncbi:Substrate binding domain of ABC-type glycine betaine transport system [Actinomyces howellii]|uniref:Substrate binding domain of ABC-type glycine betaine transport system n=1 Tax=Actinomyces howellii TaxID=52771 RepID=A0A3S4V6G8_9ACTO|nr:ABC transporter substrate-binding protein [Actinomyces howellii]VEG30104.1 Substrate binding domain of ABC-type glycine betaine transport system [Actinomyces howellii]
MTLSRPTRPTGLTSLTRPGSSVSTTRRRALGALGLSACGLALTACSSRDPFAQDGQETSGALVVGSQQYYSNEIIAELYAQVLEEAGFEVERQFRIGQREVYLPELVSGAIDVIPEYEGNLLQFYDADSGARDAASVQAALLTVLPEGLTVLDPAQATDQDSYTVTRALAQEHSLSSIADLTALGRTVVVAANSEFATRPYGPEGLKSVYGVDARVEPVEDSGGPLTLKALLDGQADAADIYTADPAIEDNDLVVLEDPEGLILPQRVTPLVVSSLATGAARAIDSVSAVLTTDELRALGARSTGEQLDAATIATDWLRAQGLVA